MKYVIIRGKGNSEITLAEDNLKGQTIYGMLKNGVFHVVSREKFNNAINLAYLLGLEIYDYRKF